MSCHTIPACAAPQPTVIVAPPYPTDSDSAVGTVTGGSVSGLNTNAFRYPVTTMSVTMPAVAGLAQVSSLGASQWAVPGLLIWVPSFSGYISVTGTSGDLITFRNLTAPAGSIVSAGTVLVVGPPPQATEEGEVSTVTALDSISGEFSGLPVKMDYTLGQGMHGGSNGWKRLALNPFRYMPSTPELLVVKRDAVNSASGTNTYAAHLAAPIWGGVGVPAPATITFPSFPELDAGLTVRALVEVEWVMACQVEGTLCVEITINGVTKRVVQFCAALAASSTAAGGVGGALDTNIRHEGPSGTYQVIIPVPAGNTAVNVDTYVRKNELTSGALDANTHYVFTHRVLGYYF